MKPSFALDLTEDGLTLLHRTSRGWMDVGNVAFDDPDLGAALDYLRSTALGLSPTGLATKLIIPESQILYLQVEALGPDDASRRTQIEAALEGRTPYALDELTYDWTNTGSVVTVAVVARETLAEAEAFATEHRFNPVSFVARPETGFDKEPFFGVSQLAPSLVSGDDTIEPDGDPVTIIAREMPKADALSSDTVSDADGRATQPETPVPDTPKPDLPPQDVPETPAPVTPPPAIPEPGVQEPDQPEVPAPQPDLPEPFPSPDTPPETPVEDPATRFAQRDPEPTSAPSPPPFRASVPAAPTVVSPAPSQPEPEPVRASAETSAAPVAIEAEAPMAVDVQPDETPLDPTPKPAPPRASVLSGQTTQNDELPPPPSPAALMAFSSRRPADGAPRSLGSAVPPSAEISGAKPAGPGSARPAPVKPIVERPASARPAPKFSYDDPVPPPPRMPGDPPIPPASVIGKANKGLRGLGTLVTAPSIPGTRAKKAPPNGVAGAANAVKPVPSPALAAGATLSAPMDASAETISARSAARSLSRQAPVSPDAIAKGLSARHLPNRGKPKYLGLILTGVLLLLLALVAAWSSFYLTRTNDSADAVQVAGADDEAIADGQLPDAGQNMLADVPESADLPVNVDLAELAAPEAEVVPEPAPVVVEPAPQTGVQDVAATAAQPDPANQDEIFLAGMDAPPSLSDPLVLSAPADRGDAPPAAQMPPPPFGTVYQFDTDGRIVPTAEGIVTPEGVFLVAGRPARVPPPRPASIAPAPAEAVVTVPVASPDSAAATSVAPTAEAEVLPADTYSADPTLSAARPRLRPEGLAADAVADEDASLAPAGDSRFASLRPRLRPP
ncbi:MAG: hypothetical protein ACK4VZ_16260, partial [Paracoccaceae bacterium]